MAYIPAGIQNANFYKLVDAALATRGFRGIADFIEKIHNYYQDEQDWRKLFPLATDSNPDRVFKQKVGTEYVPIMASYIADDADTPLITNDPAGLKTGSIPRMGNGYLFDSSAYEEARRLAVAVGLDRGLNKAFDSFLIDNVKLLATIHQQRTFTALQVESKGQYVSTAENNSGGIVGVKIGMVIPSEHKFKAGGVLPSGGQGAKAAWSSASSKPIGDLQDMYEYGWGNRVFAPVPERLVFRMSQSLFTIFKNNANVKKAVAMWKTGYLASGDGIAAYTVTDKDVQDYIRDLGLPAIEVVKTYGFTPYVDSEVREIKKAALSAFDPDTVVLRDKGALGETQWYRVSNIFSTSADPMFYTDGGSIAIQQDTSVSKRSMAFRAETLCVPVLGAAASILYLDTAHAAE